MSTTNQLEAAEAYHAWAQKPGPDGAPLLPFGALSEEVREMLARTVAEAGRERDEQALSMTGMLLMIQMEHHLRDCPQAVRDAVKRAAEELIALAQRARRGVEFEHKGTKETKDLALVRVVCAAIRFPDGLVVCGPRHGDAVMREAYKAAGREHYRDAEQGFVTNLREFVTREQAWTLATAAGQVVYPGAGAAGRLFSEHLY